MSTELDEERNKFVQRLRKILCLCNNVDITFRDSRIDGFSFTIAGTPTQIESSETHLKTLKIPFIFIEGKSEISEDDKEFQCLYCDFRHS